MKPNLYKLFCMLLISSWLMTGCGTKGKFPEPNPPTNGGAETQPKKITPILIVNVKNPLQEIKKDTLADMYLGRVTLWSVGTVRVQPCLLLHKDPTVPLFVREVLKRSLPQYQAYWSRRLFSAGRAPPQSFKTVDALIKFVASHEGAIGLIDKNDSSERKGIKTIKIVE
jgi:hypothetical protein